MEENKHTLIQMMNMVHTTFFWRAFSLSTGNTKAIATVLFSHAMLKSTNKPF